VKRFLHLAIVVVLTATLLLLFVSGANLREVWNQIVNAEVRPLLLAVTASLASYVFRAKRWQFLLRPLGVTRFASAFRATAIGVAATLLLPGRTGEVLRPYLFARREGLSAMASFATVILERLLDTISVLLLFAVFLLFGGPWQAARDSTLFQTIKFAGLAAAGVSVVAFAVTLLIVRSPPWFAGLLQRIAALLPRVIEAKVVGSCQALAAGFAIVRKPTDAMMALAGAFPLWLCSALSVWAVSAAFQLGVPWSGTFLLLTLLVVGVAVPTPGGVGGFHYAFRLGATTFYGAADDRAVAAALVLHAITFLPITLVGLVLAVQEGLTFSGLKGFASLAKQPPSPNERGRGPVAESLSPTTNQ
jgi:glycosyltransferase 2 family protein